MKASKIVLMPLMLALFSKKKVQTIHTNVKAKFSISPSENIKSGTKIKFANQSVNASDFVWDFGDGTISTDSEPIHAFLLPGEYKVNLIAMSEKGSDSYKQLCTIQ